MLELLEQAQEILRGLSARRGICPDGPDCEASIDPRSRRPIHSEEEECIRHRPPEVEVERRPTEEDFQRILEESKREEEERKEIRNFMSDPRRVRSVLRAMEGVDAKDPCFKEFGV
jgi:hypothetical protein